MNGDSTRTDGKLNAKRDLIAKTDFVQDVVADFRFAIEPIPSLASSFAFLPSVISLGIRLFLEEGDQILDGLGRYRPRGGTWADEGHQRVMAKSLSLLRSCEVPYPHLLDVAHVPHVDGVIVIDDRDLEVLLIVGDGRGVRVARARRVRGHVTNR